MKNLLYTLLSVLLLQACALNKIKYREDFEISQVQISGDEIEKTFYLIGDAGYAKEGKSTPALLAFEKYLENHKEKGNYAIFLGDNIYPDGMPKKGEEDRAISEHRLDVQVESAEDFDGEVIFIPGNHDWYNEGLKGLRREELYFEEKLKDKKVFRPSRGCPFESVEVSDQIQLMILDSQWYLEDWDKHPTMNDHCPQTQFRDALLLEIESEIKKNQHKTIVFTLHHPLYTNGVHGEQYALTKHLYPSQKKIPLPVLASLAMQIRTSGAVSPQDNQNQQYKSLVKRLETLAEGAERIVFASGHEHSLQYIEHGNVKQIVSGAGAKNSYANLSNDGLFSYSGQGFARLDVYKNGASVVSYFSSLNNEPKLIYKKEIFPKNKPFDLSTVSNQKDSITSASVYSQEQTERTDFYKSIWGEHYRNLYGTKIKAKVALLDTLYGGLEAVRPGGGHQTRSMRLVDKQGKEYNMRALKKSGVRFLQTVVFKENYVGNAMENTISEDILQDFYTSSHPYIFMVIPTLSDALGIYHTNPEVFYIPKQPTLGEYNKIHGDELYMIEERPEKNHKNLESFGQPYDIESTADLYERLRRDEKYKVDESAYIKARVFDMLIGDWDRHQDQWRWAEYKLDNGDRLFKPIPRDRDQAFSNFDGGFLGALRGLLGFANQFQVYDKELKNVKWMNSSVTHIDRTLIQNTGKEEWIKQAQFIQENLTEEVITKAFEQLPEEVQGKETQLIIEKLKGRKNNLVDIIERYHKHLDRLVIITGTDKDDYFTIDRSYKGKTKITVQRIKDGKKADTLSDRILDKSITKEIWIYGLDDDDVFTTSGEEVNNPIKIRIIGGQNNDIYNIRKGRRITVYDYKSKKNTIKQKGGATFRLTDDYNVNHFNKDRKIMSTTNVMPTVGFNPDDGVRLGLSAVIKKNGFFRNPFTSRHRLNAGYYFATQGFSLGYEGEFAGLLGDYNFLVESRFTTPNFAVNFFGFGNDSEDFQDEFDFDYNRVKISQIKFSLGLAKSGRMGSYFAYKALIEGIETEASQNRFITELAQVRPEVFDRLWFTGLDATYRYESYDVVVNPTRGMKFELNGGGKLNLNETDRAYGYVKSHLGFYNALTRNRKLVLKTAAATQFNIGKDYEFYQAAQIGGENLLRGYRNQRFSGQTSLAGLTDLRYSFQQFKTRVLPLQIGIFAGTGVGRVWERENNTSEKWNSDLGGGFWINSTNIINGTFNLFSGNDGLRVSFNFLFKF